MFIQIPKQGAHLKPKGICDVEDSMNAKYMGAWSVKTQRGWTEFPVDVFYVANPDRSKGHSNYFGLLYSMTEGSIVICDAATVFETPCSAVIAEDGEVLISRYRHDYREAGGVMIDGGRDYTRAMGDTYTIVVKDGNFYLDDELIEIVR